MGAHFPSPGTAPGFLLVSEQAAQSLGITVDLEQRGLELCGSTHTRVFFDSNYYSITWPVDSGCRGMADTEALC